MSFRTAVQTSRRPRFRRFASLGDGFTAGLDGDLSMPWPSHAARALADDGELAHRNVAAAGATSIDVALFQVQPAAAFQPDLVSVVCGANDVLSARPDPEVLTAVFDAIVDSLRRRLPGAAIVTATYPRVPSLLGTRRELTGAYESAIETANVAIREIASRRDIACLDLASDLRVGTPTGLAQRRFNSSAEDHRRVGAAFAAWLRPSSAKPSGRPAPR